MLAVKLHLKPKPWLGKESRLVPIIDWRSGRAQIRAWMRCDRKERYMTLVRIPEDHPVRICFTYGNSNFIKQVVWPMEFQPLKDWPAEYVRAITEWWDARPWSGGTPETGGLMVDEPRLFLGRRLPDSCILWTKDTRLLYNKPASRSRRKDSSGFKGIDL